tara:strand:+ start:2211 stop:2699 length:489 start_codon:yes stop_codon:yes gene_type:complete
MNVIGIDPGASGGITTIWAYGGGIDTVKMPDTERDVWDALTDMVEAHTEITKPNPNFAYIEAVHAMPKQGVVSSFKFGQNYGMLRAFLIALDIPFETVSPVKWQTALGCRTGGNKNITKAKAQELFPDIKVTHAIADALLIAEYGRRVRVAGCLVFRSVQDE